MAILLTFMKKVVSFLSLYYEFPQKNQRPKVIFKILFWKLPVLLTSLCYYSVKHLLFW